MEDEQEIIIPYFRFCKSTPACSTAGSFLLKVYIDEQSYPYVSFDVNERIITVTTQNKSPKLYSAKIRLPYNILALVLPSEYVQISYQEVEGCFELRWPQNFADDHKLHDSDVISKYLSEAEVDIREEPYLQECDRFVSDTGANCDSDDDLTRTLTQKLRIDGSNDVTEREYEYNVGCCGFGGMYKTELFSLEGKLSVVVELPKPKSSSVKDRRSLQWESERQSFDIDHYLADFFFDQNDNTNETIDLLSSCIRYKPYWYEISVPNDIKLTPNQMRILADLPCKSYPLKRLQRFHVLHSLFDIILAYAYDYRLTKGQHNSESAWNLNKLSSTFSWFQIPLNAGETITSFFRRSLTYPLCRHWRLSLVVLDDALQIFSLGRRQILNCLVSVFELFEKDEDRKILNELYIRDYLVWIQQVHPVTIENYSKLIEACKLIKKEDAFTILPRVEREAVKLLRKEDKDAYEVWRYNFKEIFSSVGNRSEDESEISTDES